MEFTKGKWYKWFPDAGKWYLRVSKVGDNSVYFDQIINLKYPKESSFERNSASYSNTDTNWKGEATSSEIQQYLPDGHIDLISKKKEVVRISNDDLIKGEIYYGRSGSYNAIFEFVSVSKGGNVKSKGRIRDFYHYTSNGGNLAAFGDELRPATPQEKQWLNACIKADKFIPLEDVKMNKRKVVHCKTQEEWNFVINKKYKDTTVTSETYRDSYYNNHRGQQCLDIKNKQHSSKDYFITQGYQILIFQEWLDENNYNNNKPISINKKSKNNEGQSIKIKRIVSNVSRGVRPGGTGFFNRRSVTTSRCRSNSYEKRAIEC